MAIVDQRLAELLWPDRPALGQMIRLGGLPVEWEVVGVAPGLRLLGLDSEAGYTAYVPIEQNQFLASFTTPTFVVRTHAPPESIVEAVHTTLQQIDPRQAVLEVSPFSATLEDWLGSRRTVAGLVRMVSALALILVAVGLYATLSFTVGQQRSDLAVHAALGASPARLLRSSLIDGLRPAAVGSLIGAAGCWALGQWLRTQLYGGEQLGVQTLAGTAAVLLGAALLAALPPSWRAAREDPARVLQRTL